MARSLVLSFIFLMDALLIVAEADRVVAVEAAYSSANLHSPASTPSSNINIIEQESPYIRKLGNRRNYKAIRSSAAAAPGLSPSEAPQSQSQLKEKMHFVPEAMISLDQETATTKLQDFHLTKKHHHHSLDKSVAGGGVILGGLGTTFLVAVVCYIRATRRKSTEPSSPVADVAGV